MPFFKRRSSSPHSAASEDDTAAIDSLTHSLGSMLSPLSGSVTAPRTRPNSFSSVASDGSAGLIGILTNVREEDGSDDDRGSLSASQEHDDDDDAPGPAPAVLEPAMLNFRLNDKRQTSHRRASDTLFADRSLPPRRPQPLCLRSGPSAVDGIEPTSPSSESSGTSPTSVGFGLPPSLNPRRRQGSLSLAVDELDFKRQKRCSVPSFSGTYAGQHDAPYAWSMGLSERERAYLHSQQRTSFTFGSGFRSRAPSGGSVSGLECPRSPVLPFSPLEH